MTPLYPLRFELILRRYLWGGRRLGDLLGKPIGPENDYAESWELCDHGADQSRVALGPLAGATLGELVARRGRELLGRHDPLPRFPLLFKFLDASRTLSVQVHPDDALAARHDPPDSGKTEAWVVLAAEPGSRVYAGLRPGVGREELASAVRDGVVESLLHAFEPRVGDCVLIPAGIVHALGAGLVVAEIQQSSDLTYRLFDWNRVGPDGRPRTLHIDEALEAIDFEAGPIGRQAPRPSDRPGVERLTECPYFVLERWRLDEPARWRGDRRCGVLAVVDGALRVEGDCASGALRRGGTILIPAECGAVRLEPVGRAELLAVFLP